MLHQLSAASGHGRCDLGYVAADAIQQLLAEWILQKQAYVVALTDGPGTNNALCQKFLVQGLDIGLDGNMTLRNGQARGAVVRPGTGGNRESEEGYCTDPSSTIPGKDVVSRLVR